MQDKICAREEGLGLRQCHVHTAQPNNSQCTLHAAVPESEVPDCQWALQPSTGPGLGVERLSGPLPAAAEISSGASLISSPAALHFGWPSLLSALLCPSTIPGILVSS